MAASISISISCDVFINHRGPDVKKNSASHLYYRLISHGLRAFLDQQELNKGENFESEIKGAIASASVHVAIFTRRYARSTWCLDELQLMLDSGFPVIPVFYKVKPAVLRWTHEDKGVYARDLDNHEKKKAADGQPRYNSTTVDKWRNALSRAAQITGFELDAFNGDEGKLLDKIVECVLKRVTKPQPRLDVAKYPTGLDEKAKDFESKVLSQQDSGKIQVVGIAGLGGVGKTTLATELFNRKSSNYSKSYFLSDVRENARISLNSLQEKLLKGLRISDPSVDSVSEGKGKLRKYLSGSPVLVVLDDADHVDQVDALLPVNVLHPESFILITSRDKTVLTRSGIQESSIYQLTGLDEHHSRELFCSYAFCQPHPPSGFESLVDRFLKACEGLPLSLKVLGGLVSGNNDKSDWEDQLTKLQQTLPEEIQKRLQISYDALDGQEKQIFLDIACFFIGEERDMAIKIWNGSGWAGSLGFRTLLNKCLVELDMEDNIRMHDHLRDLGRCIVAKHSESPRRLWRGIEDIDDLKHYSSGKRSVRGIRVFVSENVYDHQFFHQMIRNEDEEDEHNDEDDEDDDSSQQSRKLRKLLQFNEVKVANLQLLDVDFLSEQFLSGVYSPNLIWLRWYQCHLSSLPSWIPMEKLHVLEVHGKELQTLWQPKSKVPFNLRELRIFAPLSTIPKSIGKLKHLERIVVKNWRSLENGQGCELAFLEELPKEFGRLQSLKALELTWFPKMRSLPYSLGNLTNLEHIDLSGCSDLEMLPNTFSNLTMLKYLYLSHCNKLTISGETLGNIRTLKYIDLRGCDNIDVLPSQVAHQRFLEKLYLDLINLKELPSYIGELSALEDLEIQSSLLETLPPSIGGLSNLKHLKLRCHKLKCLPDSIGLLNQLTQLTVEECSLRELPLKQTVEGESEKYCMHRLQHLELSSIQILDKVSFGEGVCPNLQHLLVNSCKGLSVIGTLPSALVKLELKDCSKLRKIEGLCGLAKLQTLDIEGCIEVEELPGFETLVSLEVLSAQKCVKLKRIPGLAQMTKLQKVNVSYCSDLEELQGFENLRSLEELNVFGCAKLKSIAGLVQMTKLRRVSVSHRSDLEELQGFENLRSLEMLHVYQCGKLNSIRGSAGHTKLRTVSVICCSDLEELQGFENLRSLEELHVSECGKLKSIRGSAEHAKLRAVIVLNCSDLEELSGFENLRSLEELYVHQCGKLKSIRGSAEHTKLRTVSAVNFSDLEELPAFENLRSLKSFDVSGCVQLKSIPGLAQCTELQRLNVSGLSKLEELPGVENLRSLNLLDVSGCVQLKSIPGLAQWTELETLNVSGLFNLEELPGVENLRSLKFLDVSRCVKLNSIQGLAQWTELQTLNISGCSDLEELRGVENLRSLEYLDVSGCVKLKSIPGLAQLRDLRVLKVSGCSDLEELQGVEHLRYVYIFAEECPKLQWGEGVVEQLKKRVTYIWGGDIQPVDTPVSDIYPYESRYYAPWIVESIVGEGVVEQFKQRGTTRIDPVSSYPGRWLLIGMVNSLDRLDSLDGSFVYVKQRNYFLS